MPASKSPVEPPRLRFVVGTFDAWSQLAMASQDLANHGIASKNLSFLALKHEFSGQCDPPSEVVGSIRELPFSVGPKTICCTSGPVADCLVERQRLGARTLKDALGLWLIPRHATHFQGAVGNAHILIWVQVFDDEGERLANQSLLANGADFVGVHDLFTLGSSNG